MREDLDLDVPAELLESLEDLTANLLEVRGLVLSLALSANRLPDVLPSAPSDKSH